LYILHWGKSTATCENGEKWPGEGCIHCDCTIYRQRNAYMAENCFPGSLLIYQADGISTQKSSLLPYEQSEDTATGLDPALNATWHNCLVH
jgi:hypothetical protein